MEVIKWVGLCIIHLHFSVSSINLVNRKKYHIILNKLLMQDEHAPKLLIGSLHPVLKKGSQGDYQH